MGNAVIRCDYCGQPHASLSCHRIKRICYRPDGTIESVEMKDATKTAGDGDETPAPPTGYSSFRDTIRRK